MLRRIATHRVAAVSRRSIATDPHITFGIIAHIDAGKTTLSERMLYYSGRQRHIGEVHDGDTTMDFLAEERDRGITIQSSCATAIPWTCDRPYRLNLIDSPGHVDFTMEVERCLRVLDGAVVLLDGVVGVQVQTETVCSQAARYDVPLIAFINKLDRHGANFDHAVDTMRQRLQKRPWVMQRPIFDNDADRNIVGVADLLGRSCMEFLGEHGEQIHRKRPFTDEFESSRDDLLAEIAEVDVSILDDESGVHDVVRRAVHDGFATPVFCGSAFKNIGVQPLLDAVCRYLPPSQGATTTSADAEVRALVFKIVHDRNRGPIAFVRVYAGTLSVGEDVRLDADCARQRIRRLLEVDAGEFREVKSAPAGSIVAVVGLRSVRTGSTISSSQSAVAVSLLPGIDVPPPVFFASIEAESGADQPALDKALLALAHEDPTFVVDQVDGQTIVKGMGELHLEVIVSRLRSEFGVVAELGPMRVSYRESLAGTSRYALPSERSMPGLTLAIRPSPSDPDITFDAPEPHLEIVNSDGVACGVPSPVMIAAIEAGVRDVASRGPLLGFPMDQIAVRLEGITSNSSIAAEDLRMSAGRCMSMLLRAASNVVMLEPVVAMEMRCGADRFGDVLSDLSCRRRAHVEHVDVSGGRGFARIEVPLAELIGYSTAVRSQSNGSAHYSTVFKGYRPMPDREQQRLLQGDV